MSKVNCKHQKSIANSKIWIQFWEQIAISVCFCCCSERKRREIVTMNLRSHATLRIEHFHQKAMFIKVHLDFVHELQVQLKGLVPKNKGHTNFYEHCVLMKKYFQPTHITYLEDAKFFDRFLLLETFPIHPFCMNSYPVQICLRWVSKHKMKKWLFCFFCSGGLGTYKNFFVSILNHRNCKSYGWFSIKYFAWF